MNDLACVTCYHTVRSRINIFTECSHVDCPNRRHAWSERPQPADFFKGPWPKKESDDTIPLDGFPPDDPTTTTLKE